MIASVILLESALAFMGIGDPDAVSWRTIIGAGPELLLSIWYLTAIPDFAIVLTVMAINLVGDELNVTFNSRMMEGS